MNTQAILFWNGTNAFITPILQQNWSVKVREITISEAITIHIQPQMSPAHNLPSVPLLSCPVPQEMELKVRGGKAFVWCPYLETAF